MFVKIGEKWVNAAMVQAVTPHGRDGAVILFASGLQWSVDNTTVDDLARKLILANPSAA